MDIVKRAYLKVKEDMWGDIDLREFHDMIYVEVIRLIKEKAYSSQAWPQEFGPYPDELKKKEKTNK